MGMPLRRDRVTAAAMDDWFDVKALVEQLSGVSRDALHIYLGVAVQLFVAALPRQSLARGWPWLAALVAASANEWYDLHFATWPDVTQQRMESVKDMLTTLAIPTVLLLIARFAPALFRERAPPPRD